MSDLPEKPAPVTEEPQLRPGGPDALPVDPDGKGLGRDLPPNQNPAVDDVLPEEIAEQEPKDQSPSGEADSQEKGEDAEAGQVDEAGNPEPPA